VGRGTHGKCTGNVGETPPVNLLGLCMEKRRNNVQRNAREIEGTQSESMRGMHRGTDDEMQEDTYSVTNRQRHGDAQ